MGSMRRVMMGGILAGLLFVAVPAWCDETPPSATSSSEAAFDWSRVAAEFEATFRRYIDLVDFTRRIEAERDREELAAFEQAMDRYERSLALTELLVVMHEQELEQDFENRVSLHVRKQAFTDELVAARKRETGGR
jgi:hypothetical protein